MYGLDHFPLYFANRKHLLKKILTKYEFCIQFLRIKKFKIRRKVQQLKQIEILIKKNFSFLIDKLIFR